MHIELGRALVGLFLMVGVALGEDTKQKPAVIGGVAVDNQATEEAAAPEVVKIELTVTGYSSSPDETDEDPFTTASGKSVRDGIVATNLLPFGTKVRIPEEFGDKVFVVEDRMHRRFSNRIDVWFPSKSEAKVFGKKNLEIEILPEEVES